jgi:hypothetical protein
VSSANFTIKLFSLEEVQSDVIKEYRKGLSTQPWGAPVFNVNEFENLVPTLTTWGRCVRNSRTHLQIFNGKPRFNILINNFSGKIVLKEELKSMKRSLTYGELLKVQVTNNTE